MGGWLRWLVNQIQDGDSVAAARGQMLPWILRQIREQSVPPEAGAVIFTLLRLALAFQSFAFTPFWNQVVNAR